MANMKRWVVCAVALLLCACAHAPVGKAVHDGDAERIAKQVPGAEYLGMACSPQDFVAGQEDRACVAARTGRAVRGRGNGGVQVAYVFRAKAPIEVWRAWDPDPSRAQRLGGWWAPEKPAGTREQYRQDYQVCIAFNHLKRLVRCELRPGTVFAVGQGEEASAALCQSANERYPRSEKLQVFLYYPGVEVGAEQCTDWHVGATFTELQPYKLEQARR